MIAKSTVDHTFGYEVFHVPELADEIVRGLGEIVGPSLDRTPEGELMLDGGFQFFVT